MKKEDGIKRVCGNCRAKFYSFGNGPIICPKCNTEFSLNFLFKKKAKVESSEIGNELDEIGIDDTPETIENDIDSTFSNEEVVYTVPEENEE